MRKIALFSLVLILAMGSVGVGYAVWWGGAYNDGTQAPETDNIRNNIFMVQAPDEATPWTIIGTRDTELEGKDVSSVDADIIDNTLSVYIDNAYPGIWYYVDWAIQNTSDEEVVLVSLNVDSTSLPGGTDITITDHTGKIMSPDDIILGTLGLRLNNNAQQGDIYSFIIEKVFSLPPE